MKQRTMQRTGQQVSLLGFGLMRLPLAEKGKQRVDRKTATEMIDHALENGVNYFDTAWGYHEGDSEAYAGEALSRHDRDSYFLASKMPIFFVQKKADLQRFFDEQLRRCRTDHFDFYLVHSIDEDNNKAFNRYDTYDFLCRMRDQGKIGNIGFSYHDTPELLEQVVAANSWDFAQIQLNYVDWELQNAERQYQILTENNIPVVVMEPVRGGALANLPPKSESILREHNPGASAASWALRYVASLPNVLTVLSGMHTMAQLRDNLSTLANFQPLTDGEREALDKALAEYRLTNAIPCTNCRYCMDCPAGVDIPRVFSTYNHYQISKNPYDFVHTYSALGEQAQAHNCVSCNKCVEHCPQHLQIPALMQDVHAQSADVQKILAAK